MNKLLVVEYDSNSNNSANERALRKCLTRIEKLNYKISKLLIFLYVTCILYFIIIFDKEISLPPIRLMATLCIFITVLAVLFRIIAFKKTIDTKYNIYSKCQKFQLTFYDTFIEFNVDNKLIAKSSYSNFEKLYGTKDIFLIDLVCCIYKDCIDINVSNEIETILMDKLGERYKKLDIK